MQPLRIFQQNTGLIPVPHRGWMPRKGVVRRLIEHLTAEKWDVVGLTEVFRHSERDMIVEGVKEVLPFAVYGPDSSSMPPKFSGGALLLSRYPLDEFRTYVCRNSAGVDALCNKGLILARLQHKDFPGPLAVAVCHTQNPDAGGLEANRSITARQLEEIGQFLEQELNNQEAVLLMGDFNTDYYERTLTGGPDSRHTYAHLRMQFKGFWDLWRRKGTADKRGITFDDRSTFRTGTALPLSDPGRDESGQRLDYFFARRARSWAPIWSNVRVRILEYEDGLEISDHYGLEVTLSGVSDLG